MSVAFQQTTWHYIPEDIFLHSHRYEWDPEILYLAVFLAKLFSIPSFILEESLHSENVAPISLRNTIYFFFFSSSKLSVVIPSTWDVHIKCIPLHCNMKGTEIKTKRVRLSYMIKFAVKMPSYIESSELYTFCFQQLESEGNTKPSLNTPADNNRDRGPYNWLYLSNCLFRYLWTRKPQLSFGSDFMSSRSRKFKVTDRHEV
jgi:hypothetical protein